MPAVLSRRADSGYTGDGKFSATPLSTPPETGLRTGLGAGGGGSDSMSTVVVSALVFVGALTSSTASRPFSLSPVLGSAPGSVGEDLRLEFELLLLAEDFGTTATVLFSKFAPAAVLLAGTAAEVLDCAGATVAGCEAG